MRADYAFEFRSIGDYLRALSEGTPTPGGGSAAGMAGAMGCALGAMVCNLSIAKQYDHALAELATEFQSLSTRMLRLAEDDERVFAAYRQATAMPKSNDAERAARRLAIDAALVAAAELPLEMIETGRIAFQRLALAAMTATPHALGDLMTGGHLIQAMTLGSLENIQANAGAMRSPDDRSKFEDAAKDAVVILRQQLDTLKRATAARQDS